MKDASQPPQFKEIAQKTVSSPKNTSIVPLEISVENKILKLMSQPISAVAIQEKLNLTKPTFTLNFNSLIKSNKIKRLADSKKLWVRAATK
ncbi:MAG: hypothetical protein ACRC5V_02155 [Aeromonas sp.]